MTTRMDCKRERDAAISTRMTDGAAALRVPRNRLGRVREVLSSSWSARRDWGVIAFGEN